MAPDQICLKFKPISKYFCATLTPTFLRQKRLAARCPSQRRLIEQPKKTDAWRDRLGGHRSGITAVKGLCLSPSFPLIPALVFILLLRGVEVQGVVIPEAPQG